MKRKIIIFLFIFIFLIPTFSKGIPQVGSQAPNFLLRDEKGNMVYSKDYYGKKILILCFWTTYCKYCKEVFEILYKIDEKYNDNVKIFLVNFGEKLKKVKGFIKEKNIKLPVIFDIYGKTAERFGTFGVPNLFIIDKAGNISFIFRGYREDLQEMIEEELDKKLGIIY
jgi:peroxiredoxin